MKFVVPLLVIILASCQSKRALKQADNYFYKGKFIEAAIAYEKLFQATKNESKLKGNLAFCYLNQREFEKSNLLFESVLKEKKSSSSTFYLGITMLNSNEKAKVSFEECLKNEATNTLASLSLSVLTTPIKYTKEPPIKFDILYLDIIENRNENGYWLSQSIRNDLTFLVGDSVLNESQNLIYFTDLGTFRTQTDYLENPKLQLYTISVANNQVAPFLYNSKEYSTAQAFFSADDNTLFFISDMLGGKGGFDIYSCKLNENGWSKPENLGETINSENNELLPFITTDGTLFFATENKISSTLDVYASLWDGKKWVKPLNCNYPLPTNASDFGIKSNRVLNQMNVTEHTTKKPSNCVLQGLISDSNTTLPIESVDILLLTGKTGESIALKTNQDGLFSTPIQPINYEIRISKKGSFSKLGNLNFNNQFNQFSINEKLKQIDFDKDYRLENLDFDSTTFSPTQNASPTLNNLANLLIENPSIEIQLIAYTSAFNVIYERLVLEKKFNSILQFLKSKNINTKRVSTKIESLNSSISSDSFTYKVLKN